jgi:ABC-type dipeptide/oligopeptide/nickel transport system permease component
VIDFPKADEPPAFLAELGQTCGADVDTDMNVKASTEARERLVRLYGLDKPWPIQYGRWLGSVSECFIGCGKVAKDSDTASIEDIEVFNFNGV